MKDSWGFSKLCLQMFAFEMQIQWQNYIPLHMCSLQGWSSRVQESLYCTTYGKMTRVSLSLTSMLTNMWVIHMSQTVPFDGFHLWFRVWVVDITSMAAQSPEKTFSIKLKTVRVLITISMIRTVKSEEQILMRRLSCLPSIIQTPCTISLTALFTLMLWFLVH
jgi:hypothetical protein